MILRYMRSQWEGNSDSVQAKHLLKWIGKNPYEDLKQSIYLNERFNDKTATVRDETSFLKKPLLDQQLKRDNTNAWKFNQ